MKDHNKPIQATLTRITILLLTCLAGAASGQSFDRFEITLAAGAGFGSRIQTSADRETRIANSGLFGIRAGYAFSRSFRIEASWSHASTDLLTRDPSTGGSYAAVGTVDTDAYELNAFYDFGGTATRGYLGLGAGAMTIAPPPATLSDSETRFALNAAAGVRQSLGTRFALRAEGRYRWRDGRTRIGTTVCDGGCRPFTTNWYSNAELTAGISYRF